MKGQIYPPEIVWQTDPATGVRVARVTSFRGNHNHLYFTNNSFYDGGRRFVIGGDRDNVTNFFSVNTEDFAITQLTDLPPLPYGEDLKALEAVVDPVRNACYFFYGRTLYRLDLMTLSMKAIYEAPEGFVHHVVSVPCDGEYVYTSIYEDLSARFRIDTQHGYVGFDDIFAAKPLSRILKIRADGSSSEVIREENCWIAHVNISPTHPTHLTFCHEGPWNRVDHRIWAMDTETGEVRKLRETLPGEVIGHEYWFRDGERVGYHGTRPDGNAYLGYACFDGSDGEETEFSYPATHVFSVDESLVFGDGGPAVPYISVWQKDGERYLPGRALCGHFSSFKDQNAHPHPAITPDGKYCLFTSDRSGYEQVYLAEIPEDISSLPLVEDLMKGKTR